jgi:hypothetical protein
MSESLKIRIWILPFDPFDLEALDRLAQGGESFDSAQDREPVERLVEPFAICVFVLGVFSIKELNCTKIYQTTFITFLGDMTLACISRWD